MSACFPPSLAYTGAMNELRAPAAIHTARLRLRKPGTGDAEAIFSSYASDPDVCRYLAWSRHRSIRDTLDFLAFSDAAWQRGPAGPYLIFGEDDELLGSTGLEFAGDGTATTGYCLARKAWGRGYATEALKAMQDLAEKLGLAALTTCVHPEHRASRHVLEKCGFVIDTGNDCRVEFPNLAPGRPLTVVYYRWQP